MMFGIEALIFLSSASLSLWGSGIVCAESIVYTGAHSAPLRVCAFLLFADRDIVCAKPGGCSGCRRAPTPTGFVRCYCLRIEVKKRKPLYAKVRV